ncbi:alpha/beta fold hydrolase [Oleomonas cavernae]|uniref:Alpha/beta fold hydrolase n=1 Tax=Oleomonas cavernae TaxID=2320859 RepID=A0A418WC28_9PROT|nr:alpha/beta fold hydrolase [Oleomonas cavernae]RJF87516.1 alpha/beta fold hydrolase [Oleomonas cavernae]
MPGKIAAPIGASWRGKQCWKALAMADFLFIHGSWHGAWCWHKVVPRVEAAGHRAVAIDLPGRGRSPAVPIFVSLGAMVDAAERALVQGRKTTLVVHSRNGIVASTLAERAPDRIARIIYVASFMLPTGKRVLDYLPDGHSMLSDKVEVSRATLSDRLDPGAYREALYADCSDDDVALARSLLVREPSRPALTRLKLTPDRYGRVPRAYVRLTQDRAVSLPLQDRLLNETPVDRVESIAASHSAYFSRPDELARTIVELARA